MTALDELGTAVRGLFDAYMSVEPEGDPTTFLDWLTDEVDEIQDTGYGAPPIAPCVNCGHADYHCPASGCNYFDAGKGCDCENYTPKPAAAEPDTTDETAMKKPPERTKPLKILYVELYEKAEVDALGAIEVRSTIASGRTLKTSSVVRQLLLDANAKKMAVRVR